MKQPSHNQTDQSATMAAIETPGHTSPAMSVSPPKSNSNVVAAPPPTAPQIAAGEPRPRLDPIVLSTQKLSVWYGPTPALKEITIDIPRNRITAMIGPSGCGKSTLLRCFNRMNDLINNARMTGDILFDGESIAARETDSVALRRRIGMVFQKPNPFPKSVYNNIAWGARINGYRGDMDELVERSLRRAALWDEVKSKLNRSGLELSGGQQQRLCIARTLAVEPEVILMDEPCSALDPISTARVEDLMDDLKRDYTIVIVTHNMQQARRVSDMTACLMLDDGSSEGTRTGILAEFSPTDLLFTNPKDPRTEAYITGRIG
jgi:phosphate transport system ATP-binding protein